MMYFKLCCVAFLRIKMTEYLTLAEFVTELSLSSIMHTNATIVVFLCIIYCICLSKNTCNFKYKVNNHLKRFDFHDDAETRCMITATRNSECSYI